MPRDASASSRTALGGSEYLRFDLIDCEIHMSADLGRSRYRVEEVERQPQMLRGLG